MMTAAPEIAWGVLVRTPDTDARHPQFVALCAESVVLGRRPERYHGARADRVRLAHSRVSGVQCLLHVNLDGVRLEQHARASNETKVNGHTIADARRLESGDTITLLQSRDVIKYDYFPAGDAGEDRLVAALEARGARRREASPLSGKRQRLRAAAADDARRLGAAEDALEALRRRELDAVGRAPRARRGGGASSRGARRPLERRLREADGLDALAAERDAANAAFDRERERARARRAARRPGRGEMRTPHALGARTPGGRAPGGDDDDVGGGFDGGDESMGDDGFGDDGFGGGDDDFGLDAFLKEADQERRWRLSQERRRLSQERSDAELRPGSFAARRRRRPTATGRARDAELAAAWPPTPARTAPVDDDDDDGARSSSDDGRELRRRVRRAPSAAEAFAGLGDDGALRAFLAELAAQGNAASAAARARSWPSRRWIRGRVLVARARAAR
ncbi:hypothetical protein SO694_00111093 [Aureococcus anophagefferens]|uniref:FHA domain-containing protein n=1 Tax=Aureococcus anophagefferens TaxID=44056 RepID=A0ABR1FX16_AURAN